MYGLNRYGLTVNNAIALVAALYSIFTVNELFADPTFVREKTWLQKVSEWFQNAMPLIRQIIIAIAFVVVAAVYFFAPYLMPALICMAVKFAVSGFMIGGAIGGLAAIATGGNVWKGILDGAVYGTIDAAALAIVVFGIVTAVKAAVAAVKAANAVRNARSARVESIVEAQKLVQPAKGSLTNKQARDWYVENVRDIGNRINKSMPLEAQARQASALRNEYKIIARDAMMDRQAAAFLDANMKLKTFSDAMIQYGGDYQQIIEASMRTNDTVNALFGIL